MTESRRRMPKMVREDRISKLPSDILISIISRLNIKEATSTSVLSTCWRHLHHYVDHLDFPKYRSGIHDLSNYVSMVDHVLDSYRGGRIKKLVVDMSDHKGDRGNFEKWFDFALSKRAEIIHLYGVHQHHHEYPFLRFPNINRLECIKDLYLSEIRVTDQDFKLLVSSCLSLECLAIESPSKLKKVSIVGLSKLKCVSLSGIMGVESIVIRDAIDLVSLKLDNLRSQCVFQLSNVPKLTKLDFQESDLQFILAHFVKRIPSCINGLECIKDLYISEITMTDQDFELLVSSCLSLECLAIESPSKLKKVSIVGLSKLKCVNLSGIMGVESIVIRDLIDLVSLKLYKLRSRCVFQLSNVPKLTKLDFQESDLQFILADFVERIPSCICDQLQLMRLSTTSDMNLYPHTLLGVAFVNIQHLELVIDIEDCAYDSKLLSYVRGLVESCGSLQKLVIKFLHKMCASKLLDITQRCEMYVKYFREAGETELPIKYLEITGYLGSTWERELALHFVRNATALQKLSVVSCDQGALARAHFDFRHTPSVHYSMGSTFSSQYQFYKDVEEKKWWSLYSPTTPHQALARPPPPARGSTSKPRIIDLL